MKQFPVKELISVVKYPVLFLILCWAVFLADTYFDLDLYRFGIAPRTISGLKGILFAPLLHGNYRHIINNSLPFLILGSMIFYFYKPIAWPAILWIYVISGLWLWVGGRNNEAVPNFHFGASTLIYGFSTFLFFSGVFRKHKQLMMVSAFVVFMYGSITWGMFPFDMAISWEGHLFGAISGILVAYSYRKEGPQAAVYQWPEEEIDLEAIYNHEIEEQNKPVEEKSQQYFHITYTYVPQKKDGDAKEPEP